MSRIEKFKEQRNKDNLIRIAIMSIAGFIFVSALSYSYFITKENTRMRNFILNYDKASTVYRLQQDYLGGKY